MATITTLQKEGAFDADTRNTINSNFSALNTQLAAPVSSTAPGAANSAGTAGQIAFDATHLYVCIATNSWVRAAVAAW